jgi:hypothetical protein
LAPAVGVLFWGCTTDMTAHAMPTSAQHLAQYFAQYFAFGT